MLERSEVHIVDRAVATARRMRRAATPNGLPDSARQKVLWDARALSVATARFVLAQASDSPGLNEAREDLQATLQATTRYNKFPPLSHHSSGEVGTLLLDEARYTVRDNNGNRLTVPAGTGLISPLSTDVIDAFVRHGGETLDILPAAVRLPTAIEPKPLVVLPKKRDAHGRYVPAFRDKERICVIVDGKGSGQTIETLVDALNEEYEKEKPISYKEL